MYKEKLKLLHESFKESSMFITRIEELVKKEINDVKSIINDVIQRHGLKGIVSTRKQQFNHIGYLLKIIINKSQVPVNKQDMVDRLGTQVYISPDAWFKSLLDKFGKASIEYSYNGVVKKRTVTYQTVEQAIKSIGQEIKNYYKKLM